MSDSSLATVAEFSLRVTCESKTCVEALELQFLQCFNIWPEANHATLADRMGYMEQLMGDSFEKHAKVSLAWAGPYGLSHRAIGHRLLHDMAPFNHAETLWVFLAAKNVTCTLHIPQELAAAMAKMDAMPGDLVAASRLLRLSRLGCPAFCTCQGMGKFVRSAWHVRRVSGERLVEWILDFKISSNRGWRLHILFDTCSNMNVQGSRLCSGMMMDDNGTCSGPAWCSWKTRARGRRYTLSLDKDQSRQRYVW